jgi:hypothetical protein
MHPTADTSDVIKLRGVARRVMPGVRQLSIMRIKKTLLVCWSLIFAASALAAPPQLPQSPREISLTIDRPAGWSGVDQEGDDLNIRCTFRNRSKKTVRLMLADHNNYTGAKPFPYGLKAKVTDADGEVITYSIDMGDWYTSHYYAEGNFQDTPADWVSLKPGQEVVRVVPLAVVLRDLRLEDWEGLKAGEYTVQLRLGAAISNRIKLKVVNGGALSNNGMHPTRGTLPLIKHNHVGGRVMPGVRLLLTVSVVEDERT